MQALKASTALLPAHSQHRGWRRVDSLTRPSIVRYWAAAKRERGCQVTPTDIHAAKREGLLAAREVEAQMQAGVVDAHDEPRAGPFGSNDRANGYSYYGKGDIKASPLMSNNRLATPLSTKPKVMQRAMDPTRSWAQSTPHHHRQLARYRRGTRL